MSYKIKIYYRAGDSFSTSDETSILEYEWKNLDIAKKNLKRIKAHYEWFTYATQPPHVNEEKWLKNVPKFCVKATFYKATSRYDYAIKLLHDDGEREYQLYPFWCGYYEHLYGAKIVIDSEDKDMSFGDVN
jgi:hypothetical protein